MITERTVTARIGLMGEEAVDSHCQLRFSHGTITQGVFGEANTELGTLGYSGLLVPEPGTWFDRPYRGIRAHGTGLVDILVRLEPGLIMSEPGGYTYEIREDNIAVYTEFEANLGFGSFLYLNPAFPVREGSVYTCGYTPGGPVLIGVYQSGTGGTTMHMEGVLEIGGAAQPVRRRVANATV